MANKKFGYLNKEAISLNQQYNNGPQQNNNNFYQQYGNGYNPQKNMNYATHQQYNIKKPIIIQMYIDETVPLYQAPESSSSDESSSSIENQRTMKRKYVRKSMINQQNIYNEGNNHVGYIPQHIINNTLKKRKYTKSIDNNNEQMTHYNEFQSNQNDTFEDSFQTIMYKMRSNQLFTTNSHFSSEIPRIKRKYIRKVIVNENNSNNLKTIENFDSLIGNAMGNLNAEDSEVTFETKIGFVNSDENATDIPIYNISERSHNKENIENENEQDILINQIELDNLKGHFECSVKSKIETEEFAKPQNYTNTSSIKQIQKYIKEDILKNTNEQEENLEFSVESTNTNIDFINQKNFFNTSSNEKDIILGSNEPQESLQCLVVSKEEIDRKNNNYNISMEVIKDKYNLKNIIESSEHSIHSLDVLKNMPESNLSLEVKSTKEIVEEGESIEKSKVMTKLDIEDNIKCLPSDSIYRKSKRINEKMSERHSKLEVTPEIINEQVLKETEIPSLIMVENLVSTKENVEGELIEKSIVIIKPENKVNRKRKCVTVNRTYRKVKKTNEKVSKEDLKSEITPAPVSEQILNETEIVEELVSASQIVEEVQSTEKSIDIPKLENKDDINRKSVSDNSGNRRSRKAIEKVSEVTTTILNETEKVEEFATTKDVEEHESIEKSEKRNRRKRKSVTGNRTNRRVTKTIKLSEDSNLEVIPEIDNETKIIEEHTPTKEIVEVESVEKSIVITKLENRERRKRKCAKGNNANRRSKTIKKVSEEVTKLDATSDVDNEPIHNEIVDEPAPTKEIIVEDETMEESIVITKSVNKIKRNRKPVTVNSTNRRGTRIIKTVSEKDIKLEVTCDNELDKGVEKDETIKKSKTEEKRSSEEGNRAHRKSERLRKRN